MLEALALVAFFAVFTQARNIRNEQNEPKPELSQTEGEFDRFMANPQPAVYQMYEKGPIQELLARTHPPRMPAKQVVRY